MPGHAPKQVALTRIASDRRRDFELRACFSKAAEFDEQVAPHTLQEVVILQRGFGTRASTSSRPACGPNAMPTATARFNSTIGEGVSCASAS